MWPELSPKATYLESGENWAACATESNVKARCDSSDFCVAAACALASVPQKPKETQKEVGRAGRWDQDEVSERQIGREGERDRDESGERGEGRG